jgi:uncharacterized repeat protein (TIGR03803 family)
MVFLMFVFCHATAIASRAQILTTQYSFCSQPGCTDGAKPYYGGLVQASDGNFYGTTYGGGAKNGGTTFKITPNGVLSTLYSFCSLANCADGTAPTAGLVQATDGNFYGTTYSGGQFADGTVFRITSSGTLTTLYSFCSKAGCTDGYSPFAGLVQAKDGNFYGTTDQGGANGFGTVFQITAAGTLTTLHSFSVTDGTYPHAGLVQASDGNFYGTTVGGGAHGEGTVFRINSQSPYTLTALYSFCSQTNCADGEAPNGLVQASDGNFYGTTAGGGANFNGTAFKITSTGALTTLYSFCSQTNCADGQTPEAGLVQATDGNLYGTTGSGGDKSSGTVFKLTTAGTLTRLYSFCSQTNCADGYNPYAAVVQATDGNLYGTTSGGGANGNYGTVFRLVPRVQLVAVAPCRLVDTRIGDGGPIQGGTYRTFNLPQLAQQKGCNSLTAPAAYSLNVTVVPHGPLGYLTVWPTGQNQPTISTLNSDGRVKANAAIVPAGASEAINVFASNTTDLVLDIDGYFAQASLSTLAFYPLTPCRVADTRNPNGDLGGPYLSGGKERDFPVLESDCFKGVNSPKAYSFNFTVVPHGPLGYLTVWPTGQTQPVVSTLNDLTGTVVANAAIVPAGQPNGEIAVFPSNNTDLVIDVNGYFAAPGAGGLSLYPVVPCRVLDTRNGNGAFSGTLNPPVDVVNSVCAPPGTAQAYVFNATVVPSGPLGYLTLWPDDGSPPPAVATLNAVDGAVTSNMAIVPTTNGKINAFASNLTQLILDISSYFAP